jgi:DNA-binding MarR family transcriptional regulator
MKLESSFAEFDTTLPQFAILTMIAAYPPLSGADLARLTYLTPQTVNVIVRNLVRRGAIVKYADDVHGRILRLEITNDGRRLLKSCKSRANRIEAGLTANLSSADEIMLRGWLVRIATELQD